VYHVKKLPRRFRMNVPVELHHSVQKDASLADSKGFRVDTATDSGAGYCIRTRLRNQNRDRKFGPGSLCAFAGNLQLF
jgi:hypothetical protein